MHIKVCASSRGKSLWSQKDLGNIGQVGLGMESRECVEEGTVADEAELVWGRSVAGGGRGGGSCTCVGACACLGWNGS